MSCVSRAAEHVSPLRPVRASRSSARCSPAVGATPTTRVDCRGRSSGAPRATGNRRFTWPVFFTTNVEHTSTATAVGSPTRSSWGRCRRWSLLGRSATDSGSRRFRHRAGRLGPHRERPRDNRRRVEHARRFASARGRREHVPTLGRARGGRASAPGRCLLRRLNMGGFGRMEVRHAFSSLVSRFTPRARDVSRPDEGAKKGSRRRQRWADHQRHGTGLQGPDDRR